MTDAPEISKQLREADYDTNKLFDLLSEAADLIDQQHEALRNRSHSSSEPVGWLVESSDGMKRILHGSKPPESTTTPIGVTVTALVPVFTHPIAKVEGKQS